MSDQASSPASTSLSPLFHLSARGGLIVGAAMICCMGCANEKDAATQVVADDPPVLAGDYPVIVSIESGHETVVVRSGPTGPLYSVITGGGTYVVRDVTLAQLESNHPQVHERVRSAIAAGHARLDISDPLR